MICDSDAATVAFCYVPILSAIVPEVVGPHALGAEDVVSGWTCIS